MPFLWILSLLKNLFMKIYTKKGDGGETSDLKGGRVSKGGATIEVVGAFDELMVWIGLVITGKDNPDDTLLEEIQRLIYLNAGVLVGEENLKTSVIQKNKDILFKIETAIDTTESSLPVLTKFILPQKSLGGIDYHLVRVQVRKIERLFVAHKDAFGLESWESLIPFVNRLSDYLFVLARKNSADTKTQAKSA